MYTIADELKCSNLLKIKRIVEADKDGEKFIIKRTEKNVNFMRNYGLNDKDIKNIVMQLTVDDFYGLPERDRDYEKYKGWVLKFDPIFEDIKLYMKIRVENYEKSICLSVHEFGMYSEVNEK